MTDDFSRPGLLFERLSHVSVYPLRVLRTAAHPVTLSGVIERPDNRIVVWLFTRDDRTCAFETRYDAEDDSYLVIVHGSDGGTQTERFEDSDLFNMYLVELELALDRAGWQPVVRDRPMFLAEAVKQTGSVH